MKVETTKTDLGARVTLKGFAVNVYETDDGIVVDIYNAEELRRTNGQCNALKSTCCATSELKDDNEEAID